MAKSDIISRLRLDSGEFDSKIKRAGQELLAYSEHCKKVSLQMGFANKDAVDFAKALGSMQTTSQTARGKINELSEALVNAKVMFKNMTDAERNSEFGRNLATSLEQLKGRLQSAKKDLADVQQELSGSKFGQLGSILDGIGQKMGLNANITELLTSKTALMSAGIGAAGAIVGKAAQEWAKYNAELAKQDQITTVTTGLKGSDSDRMTDQARALTDTYGVDFREAINAANTLMTQFGQTGEQAMSLIRDGMQGMIQGDGPKLLSMIQQYAPAFRDAGVTASQLVAVIQNSEGGIFTDQNMNAIVMGIKNIRLMTKATSDALAQLGIDGQKMSQQLSDGSMTIFDALKQVATQIQGVNSNSQAAGEVMQQVFGRQGAMAGTKLGEAIATLNTNLEETKRQTGEVGDAYNDLYNANVKLNGAIRDCFEYDGWDQMATGIKSGLVSALASVIEKMATIKQFLTGMSANDYLKQMGGSDKVGRMTSNLASASEGNRQSIYQQQQAQFWKYINPREQQIKDIRAWQSGDRNEALQKRIGAITEKYGSLDTTKIQAEVDAAKKMLADYQQAAKQILQPIKQEITPTITTSGGTTGGHGGGSRGGGFDLSKIAFDPNKAALSAMKGVDTGPSEIWKAITEGANESSDSVRDLAKAFEELNAVQGVTAGEAVKDSSEMAKKWSNAGTAISAVGSAMSQIEDPAAKVVGTIAQAIATIALGYAQATTSAAKLGPWAWIAFAATGLATMISAISSIHSATGYANGGIVDGRGGGFVGGSSFSGDNIGNVRLNSGELVLNKSQQNNLANALEGGGLQGMNLSAQVSGEQILLVANRTLRRKGKGELVTWK